MTVGELKKALEGVPDDVVVVKWGRDGDPKSTKEAVLNLAISGPPGGWRWAKSAWDEGADYVIAVD
jgi:hypothetical protein